MFENVKAKEFKFELGVEAKDVITGFSGVIISWLQWIHGCNVYGLKPRELKDGKPIETMQFDEPQLELIAKDVIKPSRKTGGPERTVIQPNRV